MAWKYFRKNTRPFTAISDCNFGRKIITTSVERIDASNVVEELNKALAIHELNENEIEYLDRYYRGDQPILYREKKVRPEINKKVVVNVAKKIVDTKTAEMAGEPIQYVLRGTDEKKSEEIAMVNAILDGEDKQCDDIELIRWRSICGTAYRYIGRKEDNTLSDAPFEMTVEDPRNTFVVYSGNNKKKAMFSCQIRTDVEGKIIYHVFTKSLFFKIKDKQIVESVINGNGAIPVIEYPNNERRLSDIEITILVTDELNEMVSDRGNGIAQFVSAWIKFINCEIDSDTFHKMRDEGALVVKSNNGENRADVDVMANELNQTETQVAIEDIFEKILFVQGMANRQGNGGADTGSAVMKRNGWEEKEEMAEIAEPIFKRSERQTLRLILNRLRIEIHTTLIPADIEIKISRSKNDNMLTKAEVLQILLACGVEQKRAIKTVGLFSDPEQVAIESKARMDILYPTTVQEQQKKTEQIEVIKE